MDDESLSVVALRRAVDVLGSQAALAAVIGVTQQAVSRWVRGKPLLPAEYVLKVEEATGVSKHDLRPDIYPREDHAAHATSMEPAR